MILEGLVTTLTPEGQLHLTPMGATIPPEELDESGQPNFSLRRLILRPFQTAQTYHNLRHHAEGVFHLTDDVLLIAQAAIGALASFPPVRPASLVLGYILQDACRYYEFRIVRLDDRHERAWMESEVLASGRGREFLGFNRARHAVLEAAILATRTQLLPRDHILDEFRRLAPLVDKTGGPRELAAFQLLQDFVQRSG